MRNKDKEMPSTCLQHIFFFPSCLHSHLLCLSLCCCSQLIKQLLAIPPSSCIPLSQHGSWKGINGKAGVGVEHTEGSGSACGEDKQGCAGTVDDVWLRC